MNEQYVHYFTMSFYFFYILSCVSVFPLNVIMEWIWMKYFKKDNLWKGVCKKEKKILFDGDDVKKWRNKKKWKGIWIFMDGAMGHIKCSNKLMRAMRTKQQK